MSQSISSASVTSIVDGLKKLYIEKLKPLEVAYRFNDFVPPILVCFPLRRWLTIQQNRNLKIVSIYKPVCKVQLNTFENK